ncbi:telomerase protein component 1-like [Amphiura filiformis]|uniref:telomerase protein component 1-like n=1 Tax=Amphiura filiformis TaxID=82378 RepID=UPI003B221B18
MGCGGSRSLAVPSGPSDYKYMVQQTWDEVSKTIDGKGKNNKKLIIKRSGWKTVRVFVSSTFKDFHAEREILVKEVFPDLRQWCENRRLYLVDCDLRWGVPKDTTSEETLRMCLGEIDRCYQDNVMPFFLNLTSERCGWIPTHQDVPQSLAREYRWVQGLSVTEMEILHGAYRIENPNSLFMIRNSSFLSSLPAENKDDFVDPNPIAAHKLEHLKNMLKSKLGKRVVWYDCEFAGIDDDGKVEFNGLQEVFSKKIFDFFKERIEEQYPMPDYNLDPYQQAREAHEAFMKSRGATVLGRNNMLETIKEYVEEIGNDRALIITGGAGTGKSSITARTADVAQLMAANNQIPGGGSQGWHVFYHFVGAVPGSTDLEQCIKRLLKELNAVNDATMPKNLEVACQTACSVLSNTNTRPCLIIVDALNQFDDDKSTTLLSWLPRKLAPQVRVILSMIDNTPPHKLLKERAIQPKEIFVTPLDMEARKEIVTEMLGRYNKKLDEKQMTSLLAKESSQNPLWLAIACEELRVYGLFERITDKINSLADGLLDLLEQVFTRFEAENGGRLLVGTLCLLETSATGLLETELLQILGDEDNLMPSDKDADSDKDKGEREKKSKDIGPLIPAKWAPVYRALRPFLRPFGDSGEGRLDFYHRALSKAVRKKYFPKTDGAEEICDYQLWWHRKLADYFFDSEHVHRKVEELPTHLLALGSVDKLQVLLTDWEVFDILYNEEYSTLLLKYWRQVLNNDNWQETMEMKYRECLKKLEQNESTTKEQMALRYEQVARVVMQSGRHMEAYSLLENSMNIEMSELGGRPVRMVELYNLAGTIYDEKLKLYEYVDPSQLRELRPAIDFSRKSIAIRETLVGETNQYKLGKTLIQLAFNLQAWMECGGDNSLNGEEAIEEAKKHIDRAINIFKEVGSDGHLADAIMTKAVLEERGSEQQEKFYSEAEEMCLQAYGDYSVLTSRILLNKGIMYEDKRNYVKAYEYFIKWQDVCVEVFGYHHPLSNDVSNCLAEARYARVKQHLEQRAAQQQEQDNADFDDDDDDESDEDY